jgi:hypothetical protein
MNHQSSSPKPELAKLLREQQSAIDHQDDPLVIERINEEVWALRNKYACGSTWGKDPVFDKWWVKQVAKARHLNIIRQILMWIAIGAVAIFFIAENKNISQIPPVGLSVQLAPARGCDVECCP